MKAMYGIHNPKVENHKKITAYAYKIGIDTQRNFYYLNPDKVFEVYKEFPRVIFYDKMGNRLTASNCFETIRDTANYIFNASEIKPITEGGLEKEISNGLTASNQPIIYDPSKADITVVFYWGKFLGKYNKERLVWIERRARQITSKKIVILKLNADMQEEWELDEAKYKRLFTKVN